MTNNYDIFISYRRDGGFETAKHLYDLLVHDGYAVSFDIDSLGNGDFDTQLLKRIDQCEDFILIVDQHCFDRMHDNNYKPEDDWLRNELAHALKTDKNIIPIFLSGVNGFPNDLPDDVAKVTKKHGPSYNKEYFDSFYNKLKDFLSCRSISNYSHKKGVRVKFKSDVECLISCYGNIIASKSNDYTAYFEPGIYEIECVSEKYANVKKVFRMEIPSDKSAIITDVSLCSLEKKEYSERKRKRNRERLKVLWNSFKDDFLDFISLWKDKYVILATIMILAIAIFAIIPENAYSEQEWPEISDIHFEDGPIKEVKHLAENAAFSDFNRKTKTDGGKYFQISFNAITKDTLFVIAIATRDVVEKKISNGIVVIEAPKGKSSHVFKINKNECLVGFSMCNHIPESEDGFYPFENSSHEHLVNNTYHSSVLIHYREPDEIGNHAISSVEIVPYNYRNSKALEMKSLWSWYKLPDNIPLENIYRPYSIHHQLRISCRKAVKWLYWGIGVTVFVFVLSFILGKVNEKEKSNLCVSCFVILIIAGYFVGCIWYFIKGSLFWLDYLLRT